MWLSIRRLRKIAHNFPSLLLGFNIYVDTDKLRLIDHVFTSAFPAARTIADLGGIWKVHGAYTSYAVERYRLDRGVLVDTDIPEGVASSLSQNPSIHLIAGDFTQQEVVSRLGPVDVALFFDVLLHQANPSWDEVLAEYAKTVTCFVIFNQQYLRSERSVRLTSLPIDHYCELAPKGRRELYEYVYSHRNEIHPTYDKAWIDIHNIFQWGITDADLRDTMKRLGYREAYYRDYGQFSDLPAFENHGFIFLKD